LLKGTLWKQSCFLAGEVHVCSSGLTAEEVKTAEAVKVDDLQAIVDRLLKTKKRAVVVPDGSYVVGTVG